MEVIEILLTNENPQNMYCFMCFKENETKKYSNLNDNIEIYYENSNNTTTLRNISNYLFPFYDIISLQACEICTKLIIEMYTTIKRGLWKMKIIQKITEKLNTELESKSTTVKDKLTINLHDIEMSTEHFGNRATVALNYLNGDERSKSLEPLEFNIRTQCEDKTTKRHARKLIKPAKRNVNHILKCNKCDYKTSNKQDLESHMNKTHLNVRPYICKFCQKGFFSSKNLKEHCSTHELRNNIMVCDACGERFSYRKTLEIHMRSHKNQKPYICDTCGHKFVTTSQKNEHIKRKHGPKELGCHLCDKKYSLPKDLRRHAKNIHKIKVVK